MVVDNTFHVRPPFQQPMPSRRHGVHPPQNFSMDNSDGLGGVVVCTTQQQAEKLAFVQKPPVRFFSPSNAAGAPGVKTLAVRMEQHDRHAACCRVLARHKKVKAFSIRPPGHPQHELAQR